MKDQNRHPSKHRLRRFLILLIAVAGLWVVAWVVASALAPRVARSAIARMEQLGIGLSEVSFDTIRISPCLTRIDINDLHARFDLNPRDAIRLQSRFDVQQIEVRLVSLFSLRGSVRAEAFEVRLDASDLPRELPFDRFANARLAVGNLPLADPRRGAEQIRTKVKELLLENKAVGDVQFSGDVKLTVDEVDLVAHLYAEQKDDRFRLRFRESDIQALSDQKRMGLAPEQVEIVSLYPLRVPVIMVVTDRANDLARRHEPRDIWLRDAHRHVTWSFLLTQHFGPEFAKAVTDAQEMRPGNTPNERAMDFHNNAVGRKLYAERVPLDALPLRVREDPNIIRHPDEVDAFGAERLLR